MYTKTDFAKDLKNKIKEKEDRIKIGEWAYNVYVDYNNLDDSDFLQLLLIINKMELGEEFFFSYDELNKIAQDLLNNQPINLNKYYEY